MDVGDVIRGWEEQGVETLVAKMGGVVAQLAHVGDDDAVAFASEVQRFRGHAYPELHALAERAASIVQARGLVLLEAHAPSTRTAGYQPPDSEEILGFREFDGEYEVFEIAELSDDLLLEAGVQDWDALMEEQDVWFGQLIEGLCTALPSPAAEVLRAAVTRSPGDLLQLCRVVDEAVQKHDVSAEVQGMRAALHLLREGALEGAYGNDAHMWIPVVLNGVMLSVPPPMRDVMETRIRGSLEAIAGEEP